MSAAAAGLLTSLPVLAFAVFGALAPALARVVGRAPGDAAARCSPSSSAWPAGRVGARATRVFLALSVLALAGMAMANVLLPSLVKLHFPDRIGLVTAIYTTALAVGLTSAFLLTVPIARRVRRLARRARRLGAGRAGRRASRGSALVAHDRHLETATAQHLVRRRGPHPARLGDGAVLRAAVAAGLLDLRLVRPALARQRLLRRRRPGCWSGSSPAVSIPLSLWLPAAGRPARGPARADARGDGLLPRRLRRADGRAARPARSSWALLVGVGAVHLPDRADADRAARAHPARAPPRCPGFTQSTGLPAGGGRTVRGRRRCYDATGGWTGPLVAARGAGAAADRRRAVRRPPGVPRGPAARPRSVRLERVPLERRGDLECWNGCPPSSGPSGTLDHEAVRALLLRRPGAERHVEPGHADPSRSAGPVGLERPRAAAGRQQTPVRPGTRSSRS